MTYGVVPEETTVGLEDFQYQYSWGPRMGLNTVHDIREIAGLVDKPDARVKSAERNGSHGSFVFARYAGERVIEISCRTLTTIEGEGVQPHIDALSAAFSYRTTDEPFFYRHRGSPTRIVYCRPTAFRHSVTAAEYGAGYITWNALLIASDPKQYSTATTAGPTGPREVSGGLEFPAEFPAVFTTAAVSGTLQYFNGGTEISWPILTVEGPCISPRFVHVQTGREFTIDTTLESGTTLTVDGLNKTVLLNGVSRADLFPIGGNWIYFLPGDNDVLFLSSGAGTASLTARGAWL